jgi:hypothetical protein
MGAYRRKTTKAWQDKGTLKAQAWQSDAPGHAASQSRLEHLFCYYSRLGVYVKPEL